MNRHFSTICRQGLHSNSKKQWGECETSLSPQIFHFTFHLLMLDLTQPYMTFTVQMTLLSTPNFLIDHHKTDCGTQQNGFSRLMEGKYCFLVWGIFCIWRNINIASVLIVFCISSNSQLIQYYQQEIILQWNGILLSDFTLLSTLS